MPVRFDCPSCKAHYDVADELAGKVIMCRVCQKRGPVKTLTASPSSVPNLGKIGESASPSRRNFLNIGGLVLASLGAIATGALLARQPWRKREEPDDGPPWRRFGPPPPGDGKKQDNKGSAV